MHQVRDTFEDLPILIELRSSLDHAFKAGDVRQDAERRRRPARARRPGTATRLRSRRVALAGAVTVASLAVAGVLGFQESGLTASPAVAATMDRLAQIAANQDWGGIPGPGQYLYTMSEGVSPGGDGNRRLDQRQIWIPSSGQALLSDEGANLNDKVETIGGPSSYFPTTVSGWHALSSDPATLLEQIHNLDAPNAPDTPAEQFTNVADALRETPIPPASRALLYRAVALIPGVQLIGPQADPTGQTGLGVGYYSDGQLLSELIFDQQTARLLAELTYDSAGNLTSATSYVEQKIVNSVPIAGATPPPTEFPAFQAPAHRAEPANSTQATTS